MTQLEHIIEQLEQSARQNELDARRACGQSSRETAAACALAGEQRRMARLLRGVGQTANQNA